MEDLERLGIFLGEQAELRILLDGPGEIDDYKGIVFDRSGGASAIGVEGRNFGCECGVGQPWRNGLRDVEGGGALGYFSDTAVGELNFYIRHRVGLRSRLRLRNAEGF
jgi:hypothetical protein